METIVILAVFVSLAIPALSDERVSYDGHKVLQTTPMAQQHLAFLKSLCDDISTHIDVWRPPVAVNESVVLNVAPAAVADVITELGKAGLQVRVNIEDLQRAIDQERADHRLRKRDTTFDYAVYHEFAEILEWMETITDEYSSLATTFDLGCKTYEGRSLMGVKISSPTKVDRPAVWIQGGIHAREWISPAVVIYIVSQLLVRYDSDSDVKAAVDMFDWYFLPVVNPDGYDYTWTNDRMWRKNRTPSTNSECVGTDVNQNWDLHWCETGASGNPCAHIYCGSSAFSETETDCIANYILSKKNFKAFMDVHSYSQLWMSPWSYTTDKPADYGVQNGVALLAVKALKAVHGTTFRTGQYASVLYTTSGTSTDWAYGKAGIKFSYMIELRDTGRYGFMLPESEIIPSGEEMTAALLAIMRYIDSN